METNLNTVKETIIQCHNEGMFIDHKKLESLVSDAAIMKSMLDITKALGQTLSPPRENYHDDVH